MKITILFIFTALTLPTFAQDARTWSASVGVGVGAKRNLRKDNRYEDMDKKWLVKPIPFIQGSVGRFSLGAQGISFRAAGNQMMNASVFITRSGDRYQGLGMGPRKDSAFVGISAKFFKYGLNLSHDINGRSKGYTTQFNYGEFFPLTETLMLRAGLSLDWHDDRYAEYYYGVRKTEATATRQEYHLNSYIVPGVSVLPIYKITDKLSMTSALSFKLLPRDVYKSPTMTGKKIEIGMLLGLGYSL